MAENLIPVANAALSNLTPEGEARLTTLESKTNKTTIINKVTPSDVKYPSESAIVNYIGGGSTLIKQLMPDMSTGIQISSGYVTTYPCFLYAKRTWGNADLRKIYVNGIECGESTIFDAWAGIMTSIYVDTGSTITFSAAVTATIFSLKGA